MRIVTCNANRLRDNDLMREVVEEMNRRKVHIVIWTETHFEQKHSIEFEKIAEKKGYKTYSVTRWMKRYDSGSGGVTIMIDKQFQSKERKDDYIAVSAGIVEKTSNAEYWSEMKDTVHTNHCGVACTVQVVSQQNMLEKGRNVKRKKKRKVFG